MATPSSLQLLERAQLLRSEGRLEDAAKLYRAVLDQPGPHGQALVGLASILEGQGRFDAGLACIERALPLLAQAPEVLLQRARLLQYVGRHDEALAAYAMAAASRSDYAAPLVAKAQLLTSLRRYDEARAAIEQAIAAKPHYAEARYIKGELLLLLGELEAGWELFESRLAARFHKHDPRTAAIERWRGEPLPGMALLIQGEIGLGDFLMFARYLPFAQALAGCVILAARKPLMRVLAESFPDCTVVHNRNALPPADRYCTVMSLPHLLRDQVRKWPSDVPYLKVPGDAVAKWRALLGPKTRPRIGLMASGRVLRVIDRDPLKNRSIPAAALRPLLDLPFDFHSLHNEGPSSEDAADDRLADHSGRIEDLADTGALALQMDLVVSIDTSIAHLAGGLGIPLWVLLPFASDYRWERGPGTSWYPHARLFRQQVPGHWDSPVRDLVTALAGHFHLPQP